MKAFVAVALAVLGCSVVLGTTQEPDRIVYEGKEYGLFTGMRAGKVYDLIVKKGNSTNCFLIENCYPLEKFFDEHPEKTKLLDDKRIVVSDGGRSMGMVVSSDLSRGYVATFEINDKQLYLKDIKVQIEQEPEKWDSALAEVVSEGKPLKIDWLTGFLILPLKKSETYKRDTYWYFPFCPDVDEKILVLEIDKGELKSEKTMGLEEAKAFARTHPQK